MSREHRGSNIIWSALRSGALILLLLGILDLGRVAYAYSDLSQTAREAARYAAAHPGDIIGTRRVAQAWSTLDLKLSDIDVTFTNERPAAARVAVRYRYRAVSLLVVQLTGGDSGITLLREAEMLVE